MRFSAILLSATLAALSAAQNETVSTSTVVAVTTTYSLTPAQSSQASCLQACPADDPSCRAACIVVDEGDYSKQNRTIDCISECPKGNGTETDNLNFENCQKGCLASATITSASTTASQTGTRTPGASTTGGNGNGNGNGNEPSGTGSQSPSGTGGAATETPNVAGNVQLGMGALIGLGSLAFVFGL